MKKLFLGLKLWLQNRRKIRRNPNSMKIKNLRNKDVKFSQLYIIVLGSSLQPSEWDQTQCQKTDQANAALIKKLKQLGLLENNPSSLGRKIR